MRPAPRGGAGVGAVAAAGVTAAPVRAATAFATTVPDRAPATSATPAVLTVAALARPGA
ncbi:hypothetical protein [Streptomyces tagetis]|uniref:Uncharacterized protein n=1 Tax=Streptomyces tagetis TaxID=2820809 RepID=A0A940XLZ4_9ACTN|nr:hypothetical protein [Streptomyces sp. RG38]MBQ0827009.1 hypothetical protein [Streptomyces sp. RG38]